MSRDEAPDPAWSLDSIDDNLRRVADALEKLVKLSTPEPVTRLRAKMPPRFISVVPPIDVGKDAGFTERA